VYNPSSSTTSQDLEKTFTITYGGGASVSGEQYSDVVSVAGLVVRGTLFFAFREKCSQISP
jgi:cathepsin D